MPYWLELIIGIAALILGADLLVRGAATIARGLGVAPIVIGLTLVAYGTSAPEFAVSATATLRGVGSIALGNALGSNVANIGLVLGVSALLRPITVERTIVKREAPLLVLVALLFPLVFLDGYMARWEGLLAFAGGIAFTVWSLKTSKKRENVPEKIKLEAKSWLVNLLFVGLGVTGLVFGGDWIVNGAGELALRLGLSPRVIALTVVAVGTSLPELATSVTAMIRDESDIAIGNIIGSNLFNLLFVLGGAVGLAPVTLGAEIITWPGVWFDAAVGLGLAVLLWPFASSKLTLERWEGGILLAAYAAYIYFSITLG
jgi:cation:H+ antiporter